MSTPNYLKFISVIFGLKVKILNLKILGRITFTGNYPVRKGDFQIDKRSAGILEYACISVGGVFV